MRKARNEKSLRASQGINPGDVLLSHTATRAVPSAPKSLTSEFGMGSGVASSKSPPETVAPLQGSGDEPSTADTRVSGD